MNMMEQIWAVRDARGLDTYEKNFLMVVASRGEAGCFCEWKRNSEDMGMKKDAYYNRRNSLIEKGLITAWERDEKSTVYKINNDVLAAWHSVSQNDDSVTQNDLSATQNDLSVRPERKKNIKINDKKNLKKNTVRVGDAHTSASASVDSDLNIKDKDEEALAPDSPIVEDNAPASPIEVTTEGHSVTQNEDDYYDFHGQKILKSGRGNPFDGVSTAAPVEPEVKCAKCNKEKVFHDGLCFGCVEV